MHKNKTYLFSIILAVVVAAFAGMTMAATTATQDPQQNDMQNQETADYSGSLYHIDILVNGTFQYVYEPGSDDELAPLSVITSNEECIVYLLDVNGDYLLDESGEKEYIIVDGEYTFDRDDVYYIEPVEDDVIYSYEEVTLSTATEHYIDQEGKIQVTSIDAVEYVTDGETYTVDTSNYIEIQDSNRYDQEFSMSDHRLLSNLSTTSTIYITLTYTYTYTDENGDTQAGSAQDTFEFAADENNKCGELATYLKNYANTPNKQNSNFDMNALGYDAVITADTLTISSTGKTRTATITLPTTASVTIIKTIDGRDWLESDSFTFSITAGNDTTQEAIENGTVVIPETTTLTSATGIFDIDFYSAGTYNFTVAENAGEISGLTYDDTVYTIEAIVTDADEETDTDNATDEDVNEDASDDTTASDADTDSDKTDTENDVSNGSLTVELSCNQVEFVNTYSANPITTSVTITKTLEGRDWLDSDSFTFSVTASDDATQAAIDSGLIETPETVTLTSELGLFDITAHAEGSYAFAVSEVDGQLAGITYDDEIYEITVSVMDNLDGTLSIDVSEDKLEFVNIYSADFATASISITKNLEGRDWLDTDSFTFTIAAGDDETQTAIDEGLSIIPETITLTSESDTIDMEFYSEGTYTFEVEEVDEGILGITYDTSIKEITVTVTDNNEGNLVTKISGDDVLFTNVYEEAAISNITETGDDNSLAILSIAFAAIVLGGVFVVAKTKRGKNNI